ncbi:ATP-dependent DNA helicase [Frankliniella fusca]|uniref:ATP-dependent DNA helicase n=1 Tax=Frankliniella fusca TaxID=407009 RepID=A0AAE1HJ87_9NEOP|nr:ATP-dependent DNA helicase [Frankliniella fusca]
MNSCEYTGCRYWTVQGDGLCFYRAASVLLYKTEARCLDLHKLCINHVAKHWMSYKNRYNFNGRCKYDSAADYRSQCLKKKANGSYEYATDVEIEVMSELLQINIILIGVGPSALPHDGDVYPLGYVGSPQNTNGTLSVRVRNHGSQAAHFEPFSEIPAGYKEKLDEYLEEVFGQPMDQTEPVTPKPGRGRPKTPKKTKKTPTKSPKTPTRSPKTPVTKSETTPKPKAKRRGFPEVPQTPTKLPRTEESDAGKVEAPINVYEDPTMVLPVPAFDIVEENCCSDDGNLSDPDDPPYPGELVTKSPDQKNPVPRLKPWAALPNNPTTFPTFSMKVDNLGTKARYYMAAAVHDFLQCQLSVNIVERFSDPPSYVSKVLDLAVTKERNQHPKSSEFKANILAYNRMFSTVQFRRRTTNQPRKGPFTVQSVNGKVTFEPNSYKNGEDVLAPGQIYFVENDHDTINYRMATSAEGVTIDPSIVELFERYLHSNNGYVRCFQTTAELKRAEEVLAISEGRQPRDVILAINPRPKQRSGYRLAMNELIHNMLDNEFARPCRDFLAAVFYGSLADVHYDTFYVPRPTEPDDVFPRLTGSELTLDIQTYPLLHLHAEDSWSLTKEKGKDTSSTLRQYYNYRLQVRFEDFNPLFSSGRLFSEYLLNAAVRIEKNKLDYLQQNQVLLKASSYKLLKEYIRAQAASLNKTFVDSKLVILPKSFTNSPRWRQDRFLNGMAMARKFGPPTYFITMTTNPKWPEITAALKQGEKWTDRPDIVVRVFQDRKRHLLSDFINKQIFGEVKAYFTTDEFQKSSLPHCHILLFIVDEDKPKSPEEIDRLITAEIPDKDHPAYNMVVEHMMHHACDKMTGRRKPGCFADGQKCRFRFPQKWCDETDIDSRYVSYRRRQDGKRVQCKTTKTYLDNRNTVPTNHYVIYRHQCHVCCLYSKTTVEAFKYLCIYFNKGGENTYVSITDKNKASDNPFYEWNEIEHYRECRYLNAAEAVYIIKAHEMGLASHAVFVLPFHEEDLQTIIFEEGNEEGAVTDAQDSMLMGFFKINEMTEMAEFNGDTIHNDPRDLLYVDMPTRFTWDRKKKEWHSRKSGNALGRLGVILPNDKNLELFHLRALLMNIKGPTCFQDLKTKDGTVYDTYTEACIAWGLAENSKLPFQILAEITTVMNPSALRYNFCIIIKFCHPKSALALWEVFKDNLSEDFAPRGSFPTIIHHNVALHHISELMKKLDMIYSKTDLPEIDKQLFTDYGTSSNFDDDPVFNIDDLHNDLIKLRPHQLHVYEKIVAKINKNDEDGSNMFLLLGAGGVGKTFVYNTLIKYCMVKNIAFGACAYTGIAATLLLGGQTAHKLFGIPLKETEGLQFLSSISTQSEDAKRLIDMKVIIWDEISMVHKWQLEIVDKFLRSLTGINKPFANKIMVFSGSLRQILPVQKGAKRKDIIESCIINSKLWEQFEIIEMTHNIRAEDDPEFSKWLLKVGDGTANQPGTSRVDLPLHMRVETLDKLIEQTFPNGPEHATGEEVILTPLNRDMREINDRVAELLPGKSKLYLSYNKFQPDDTWEGVQIPITSDLLESTDAANLPPHRLNLKEGSIIMLLCNLDVRKGLCNGSRFRVLKCLEHSIKCQRLYGPKELINEPGGASPPLPDLIANC